MPETYQSILVDAPADKVWERLRLFHDLSWAPNVITDLQVVGDVADGQAGAKRLLNEAFSETLIEIDDAGREFRYSIDDGPSPVSADEVTNYVGRVRASPVTEGSGTFVEWSSSWESNADEAVEFCQGIYVALLNDLAKNV